MTGKNTSSEALAVNWIEEEEDILSREIVFVGPRQDHRAGFLKITEQAAGRRGTVIVPLGACAALIMSALRLSRAHSRSSP